jgi:fibronectin-binding autotransporter adhesin
MSRLLVSLATALLLGASGLRAQTWDGGGTNNNWNTKNNWNPNTAPSFNNSTGLIFTGSTRTAPDMNGSRTVNSITFDSGAASFTLSGTNGSSNETLTFNGTGAALAQNSANDQSLLMNRISFNSATTITLSGAGDLYFGDGTTTAGLLYGSNNLTKTGTGGALILSADNSNWSGALAINAGVVEARADNALGDTAGVTTVAAGATLNIGTGGLAIGENFTLAGTGSANTGALRNVAGSNSISGAIVLGAATRINSDTGTLTLSGDITGAAQDLTLGSTGNITVSGVISTTTGKLTKDGAGTLILSGANTYSGTTTISTGTLQIGNAGTSGAIGAGGVANNSAITFNRSNSQTVTNAISGTGSLSQSGTGTTILTGTNSYAGATTITAGVLNLQNATALGTSAAGTSVTSGAALELQGDIAVGAEALALNGTGVSSGGALRNLSGTNSYAGALTLGSASRINSDAGALTLSGNISGAAQNLTIGGAGNTTVSGAIGTTAGTLTKDGAGTVVLTGANTYSGTTTISAGTLQVGNAGTSGTLGSGSVTNNAILAFNRTDTAPVIANAISGTGSLTQAGSGTTVLTGANTYAGATTISAGTLQVGNAGTSGTLGSGSVTNNSALVFNRSDAVSVANVIAGTGSLTQAGTGTTTLSGANTFSGGVSVASGGTLSAQSASALGGGTAGTAVASGGALNLQSAGTLNLANNGTLSLAGTGVSGSGALNNSGGNNSWLGNITLTADTTIAAASGTLNLGNVSSGYASHTLVAPVDTNTLSLGAGRTLTFSGSGTAIWVNSRITESSAGNVIIDNAGGTVNYNPYMNSYTGTTTVKAGTLNLLTIGNQEPGNPTQGGFYAINGPLVIGDGVGAALSAAVGIGVSENEVLNFTTAVTMNSDGLLSLSAVQTINALTFNGGKINIAIGGLYLDSAVTVNAGTGNVSSIDTSTTGQLSLTRHFGGGGGTNADRVFNIGDATGSPASDLNITAQVVAGGIVKNGTGTMTLGGTITNTYERATVINNGTLALQKNTALGGATGVAADGTTVNGDGVTNGTLQLQNNITVTSENLYLNNTGYTNQGALNNASGNNTWAGYVELQSDARIQSDSGLLTLAGTVYTPSFNLDVRGIADTTISGSLTGAGNLVKNDSGKLILSGNNTFSGTTVVNAGILSMQNNGALGGIGTTTVNSGAVLQLDSTANGNLLGGDTTTTVSGTGIGGTGVVRNVIGNNNYTGQLTLAAASLVTANTGTTLTLSGGTTGANLDLTVGTTAQNGNVIISGAMSNGTGQLTKAGSGDLTFAKSTGVTGTVGATHLNAGTLTVGADTGSLTTLNTGAIDSVAGTILKLGSLGKVTANYASGNTNMFGTIDKISASGGTFEKTGAGTLTFNTTFNFAGNLILSGGTLALANSASVTFANIYITANTTIDFGSGTSTILSSANLFIAAGVQVSVINWVNNGAGGSDDIWYATNAFNNYTGSPASPTIGTSAVLDVIGAAPENQITFTGIAPAANTSWVSVQGGQYYDHEIRPIPEPSTYGALLLGGCIAAFGWRRYRRSLPSRR